MNTTLSAAPRFLTTRFFRLRGFPFMALAIAGTGDHGIAATLELPVLRDSVLYERATGDQANGAGDFLIAGRNNQAENSRRRSLLQFDLSAVPAGAMVSSVALRLHLTTTVTTGDAALSLHRVTLAWTEGPGNPTGNEPSGVPPLTGDSTWLHASFPGNLWTSPGGDFAAAPSAVTTVTDSSGFFTWSGPAMVDDVNAWLANPGQNFGWLLRTDESAPQTAKRFESGNNVSVDFRPELVIEFSVIPEPSVSLLAAAALISNLGQRRRRTSA